MYARTKRSRNGQYLQIVESRRVDGQPRQRLVLYVGHYTSVEQALAQMPKELAATRREATKWKRIVEQHTDSNGAIRAHAISLQKAAEDKAERLRRLRALVEQQPELLRSDQHRRTSE